jgi:membrane peptidoglycan carboxypeptidase
MAAKLKKLLAAGLWLALPGLTQPASPAPLETQLGRNEVRVLSAAYPLAAGRTVQQAGLVERLQLQGYQRVHRRPERPGEFFYGHEVFWIFRRAHRWNGRDWPAAMVGLRLRRADGQILGGLSADGGPVSPDGERLPHLEPETLAESLRADRARRWPVVLSELPERVWRPVLAAEDARFFEHAGIDARAVARAALANLKQRRIAEGGSTITQQLIKNRDLNPERSLGRKASEAVRALLLEAEYDKREILQAYLNQVYLGHVNGLAVHGIGAAARVYFSKSPDRLSLAEAATLAAMIQGPNRLSPQRDPERLRERRDWVLSRLEELEWESREACESARKRPIEPQPSPPRREGPVQFLAWLRDVAQEVAPRRLERGRGVVLETALDPLLQRRAEEVVAQGLERLRRREPRLRQAPLSAVLLALDPDSGEVLVYVGGDPAARDGLDRVRGARRQPGSTVKPFVMLEAFDRCGKRKPLHPASRIADEPLILDLEPGSWEPTNHDGRFRGTVRARRALAESLNVPTVRVAGWCGLAQTARTFDRIGLDLPQPPPPSFVLGSVETTPLRLATAYTVLATPGWLTDPLPLTRIEKPNGELLHRARTHSREVAHPAAAWLVRDLLTTAVASGTATVAAIEGLDVAAKTGSSSRLRDAWFVGHAGSVVALVWVGLDDAEPLGLTGAAAAGPIWRDFMVAAVPARPPRALQRPKQVVARWIDPESGLRVREGRRDSLQELFRKGKLPPRNRFWRVDRAVPVVE